MMRAWVIYSLLFVNALTTVSVWAQGRYADNFFLIESYDSTLVNQAEHTELVKILVEYHQANDDTTRLRLVNSISSLFQKPEYKRDYAKYGLQLANARPSGYDPLVEERVTRLKIDLLRNQGLAYNTLSIRDRAFETIFTSLRMAKKLKDSTLIGMIAIDLGMNYLSYGRLDQALEFLEMANTHLLNSNDYETKAYSAYMLGVVYSQQGDFDLSVEAFENSIQTCNQMDNLELRGLSSFGQAYSYLKQGSFNEALKSVKAAIADLKKINNHAFLSQAYYVYSSIYFQQKKWQESRKYALLALEYAEIEESLQESRNANERLYLIALNRGNYKQAFEYYQAYVVIRDSIMDITNAGQIAEQKVKYDYEQQAIRDSVETAATLKIEYERAESKTRESRLLWVGLVIILLFAAILFQRFRVISKQRAQLETDRIKLNNLNLELNESNDKLRELDSLKSEFFTNVSHEFRTPLTVISGMAKQVVSNPEKNAVQGAELILTSSTSLLAMVDQILQLRKLESGTLETNYAKGDVVQCVNYAVVSLKSYAEDQLVSLSFSSNQDQLITGYDSEKLQSIITNLISNAIKYNRKNGLVNCTLNVLPGAYEISVEDTGIGIAKDKLPHIFEQYFRVDNSETREQEGTGVGLALVQQLVNIMNGSISVDSELGSGTKVVVSLPKVETTEVHQVNFDGHEEKHSLAISENQKEGRGEKILIVEDNTQVKAYMKSLLEPHYNLSFAANGEEGVDSAVKNVPDIIISDVMMPRKSGFDLVQELKSNMITNHIPIVLLTAKADIESKLEGLAFGADAYLAKPFNQEELKQILTNFLQLRERIQSHYAKFIGIAVEPDRENPDDLFIKNIQDLLEKNLDNCDYDISTLCTDLGLARSQVHNKLKAIVGMSAAHFVQRYKVEKAKVMLTQGDMNTSEVSYALGFNSPNYFSTVFAKIVGISPSQFKEKKDT